MELIKLVHVSCAVISIIGFVTRGILMMVDSPLLKARLFKMAPHLVDTGLLATAIILAVQMGASPSSAPWVMAKIIALLFYIGLGMVALRFGATKTLRVVAWCMALFIFVYIVAVAVTKNPFII